MSTQSEILKKRQRTYLCRTLLPTEPRLRVDGLTFQDGNDSTNCMKKVDAHGFVDLRNSLKVSDGYGKNVSLSVIFKDRVIFQQQFQIELRDITSVRKELEDDLITSACAVNDLKRELECLQYEQLHIQKEIKYLQVALHLAETGVYEVAWDLNADPRVLKDHIDESTALHTLKTPKLEVEDDLPTGSASLYQKELEDNPVSTAIEMNDCSRELERIRFIQLQTQHKIENLQVKSRLFFENAWVPQLLAEKKLELVEIGKWLKEENEAYRQAIEKFLTTRDKYNNLTRGGSDVPIDEGRSQ